MTVRHAIIAGVNKCGTTSVFRYLADHPDVCASLVKETRYFSQLLQGQKLTSYEEYLAHFPDGGDDDRYRLEASPDYFSSDPVVASGIKELLPDVKIIVIVRDPVTRLVSYYRSALVYDNYATALLEGMSFSEFVDAALTAENTGDSSEPQAAEFRRALRQGCYGRNAEDFLRVFSPSQCGYFFFEDLAADSRKFMKDICTFLGIAPSFFQSYEFRVENKTRAYRSTLLQKLGFHANTQLEPFFNRHPKVRRFCQDMYRSINERRTLDRPEIDSQSCKRLKEYYRNDSVKLVRILSDEFGMAELPRWLRQYRG